MAEFMRADFRRSGVPSFGGALALICTKDNRYSYSPYKIIGAVFMCYYYSIQ